jgi:hypothetical protein
MDAITGWAIVNSSAYHASAGIPFEPYNLTGLHWDKPVVNYDNVITATWALFQASHDRLLRMQSIPLAGMRSLELRFMRLSQLFWVSCIPQIATLDKWTDYMNQAAATTGIDSQPQVGWLPPCCETASRPDAVHVFICTA